MPFSGSASRVRVRLRGLLTTQISSGGTDLGAGKDKVVQTDWGRGVGVILPLHVTP